MTYYKKRTTVNNVVAISVANYLRINQRQYKNFNFLQRLTRWLISTQNTIHLIEDNGLVISNPNWLFLFLMQHLHAIIVRTQYQIKLCIFIFFFKPEFRFSHYY